MGRSYYSAGKRQREREKAKRKKEKMERLRESRAQGSSPVEVATVDEIQGGDMMSAAEVLAGLTGDNVDRSAEPIPARLFVGGLSWRVTTDQLRSQFEELGKVKDAVVVTDRATGDSRGFGFITMADRKDANTAIRNLNGKELEGRTLVVRQAKERN